MARLLHFADEHTHEVYRPLQSWSKTPIKTNEETPTAMKSQVASALSQPEERADDNVNARGIKQRHCDLKLQAELKRKKLPPCAS